MRKTRMIGIMAAALWSLGIGCGDSGVDDNSNTQLNANNNSNENENENSNNDNSNVNNNNTQVTPQSPLIAHWRFNNSSHDETGNHDATLLGGAGYYSTALERSHALDLDGSGRRAACGSIDLGDAFSVSGWYRIYGGSGLRTVFANTNDDAPNGVVGQLDADTGVFRLVTGNGTDVEIASSNAGQHDTSYWVHFAYLVDRAGGTGRIYVNGVDQTSPGASTIRSDFANHVELQLGLEPDGSGTFWGYLDDVRLHEGLLSDAEINSLHTGDPVSWVDRGCQLSRLHVEGNDLVNAAGTPILLKGFSYIDQGDGWFGSGGEVHRAWDRGPVVLEDFAKMVEWGANFVRLMVIQDSENLYLTDPDDYLDRFMDRQVDLAEYFGMYAAIDFHDYCQDEQSEMVAFWDRVAQRYAGHEHVIYEIINEPSQSDDSAHNPCNRILADPWGTLKASAEASIDAIRAHDPDALVIVNGLRWGYDVREALLRPVDRPNVVYGTHPYPGKLWPCGGVTVCTDPEKRAEWQASFGDIAALYPVILTEFGWVADGSGREWDATTTDFWVPLVGYINELNLGYLAFAFTDSYSTSTHQADDGNYALTEFGQNILDDFSNAPPTTIQCTP